MFYFIYKIIIFSLNKEKDDMQGATVNSHNLEKVNHIAHVIFFLHENTLVD